MVRASKSIFAVQHMVYLTENSGACLYRTQPAESRGQIGGTACMLLDSILPKPATVDN